MTSAGYKTESEDYQPTESGGYQPTYDQAWWDHTACRRMCAGTYLDPKFRDRLLREVYNARNRRVAPSYGYDVTPVLAHAWFAWWLEMVQHAAVLLIFLFVSIIFPLDAIIAASILAIIYFAHRLVRLAIDFTAYYRGLESALEYHRLRTRRRVITFGMLASLAILVGAALLVLHSGYNKDGPPQWPAHGSLVGSTLLLIVTVIVVAAIAAARQIRISSLHTAGVHPLRPRGNRFDTIALQQYHPFTVYSGFKPFVGSGIDIRVWSFAQRLVQADITGGGKNEFGDVLPFTAQQLIASLRNTFDGLRNDQNPETRLPGLIVKDHVLLEGTHANPFRHVLGSAPESSVVENEIARVITNSSDVARHYLACQVPSWAERSSRAFSFTFRFKAGSSTWNTPCTRLCQRARNTG